LSDGLTRDAAVTALASQLANRDADRAAALVDSIGEDRRREAVTSVADAWSKSDPDAARVWLASRPELTAEEKQKLFEKKRD
jgi:hypothetical protein